MFSIKGSHKFSVANSIEYRYKSTYGAISLIKIKLLFSEFKSVINYRQYALPGNEPLHQIATTDTVLICLCICSRPCAIGSSVMIHQRFNNGDDILADVQRRTSTVQNDQTLRRARNKLRNLARIVLHEKDCRYCTQIHNNYRYLYCTSGYDPDTPRYAVLLSLTTIAHYASPFACSIPVISLSQSASPLVRNRHERRDESNFSTVQ